MRFLSLVTVVVGLLAPSSVSAACNGAVTPGNANAGGEVPLALAKPTPGDGGSPSQDARILFWTYDASRGGNMVNVATANGFASNYPGAAAANLGGLDGADFYCNLNAMAAKATTDGENEVTTLVQDRAGLFKAILSTPSIDANSRFFDAYPFDVMDANGKCITDSVENLFGSSYNLNNVLVSNLGQESGITGVIPLFTGSNSDGSKWSTGDGTQYCGNVNDQGWTRDTAGADTSVGILYGDSSKNNGNGWLGWPAQTNGCQNGYHYLCLQLNAYVPPNVGGDPQFVGLQGQSFQVHGMPEEFFNLITTPDMQLNSRFTYLAAGVCNYNNTECWTHPGTYIDQIGFMFPGLAIKAIAGTHDEGMKVYVNEKRVHAGAAQTHHTIDVADSPFRHGMNDTTSSVVTVSYSVSDVLVVSSPLFTVTATNSDMFFNFGLSFHSPSLLQAGAKVHHIKTQQDQHKYPTFPLHGLLGQTWKNARYNGQGKYFQGQVDDYMLLDSKLFSTKFVFNQYKH